MDWIEATLLGLLQGLTEFLPVSSSGHLEIGKELLGIEATDDLLFTTMVHAATVLSTIVVFRRQIWDLLKGFFCGLKGLKVVRDENGGRSLECNDQTDYLFKIVVSMLPVLVVGLFFWLPSFLYAQLGKLLPSIAGNRYLRSVFEGVVRVALLVGYMALVSLMNDIRRTFQYHGAEHKTIRCYEAGDELTVENVRSYSRMHPRCGTSFLFVVLILSILLFSVASTGLLALVPELNMLKEDTRILYNLIMIVFKLLLLPVVVSIAYEINRMVGRHDNGFTRALSAPGLWMQNFTTNEPDDSMIEVGIAAVQAVLPEEEGADLW